MNVIFSTLARNSLSIMSFRLRIGGDSFNKNIIYGRYHLNKMVDPSLSREKNEKIIWRSVLRKLYFQFQVIIDAFEPGFPGLEHFRKFLPEPLIIRRFNPYFVGVRFKLTFDLRNLSVQ